MKKLLIVCGISLGIIILILLGSVLAYSLITSSIKSSWEAELRTKLTATDSYSELNDSISSLGVMLGNEDSNWIAIDYRDTHKNMIASKAVARMKDGTLFVSDQHHCGLFSIYADFKETWKFEQQHASESERWSFEEYCTFWGSDGLLELVSLESAPDPQVQQSLLIQLGFKPISD